MSKNDQEYKLTVGITIGDVGGIGPELILKAFQDNRLKDLCIPVLYGSSKVLNIYRKILQLTKFNYTVVPKPSVAQYKRFNIVECIPDVDRVEIGQPSDFGGEAAFRALKRAVEDALHKELDAIVTMPVDKSTFQKQDNTFRGHTELLTQSFGAEESLMMMVSEQLRVGLVTNHVAIKNVALNISVNSIIRKAELMHESLKMDFNIQRPLIAVLGLNPHAGDNDLLGNEESEIIIPAINELQKKGILAQGPYPADGFFGSMSFRKFDGVLAMYHDQGLVPFKLLAGYSGVNFTAGIPFIRTSPDHGVAFDIAGKNMADPESLRQSLYLAIDVYRNRTTNISLQENALKSMQKHKVITKDEDEEPLPELDEESDVI